jgi:hypothetical protein
MAFDPNSLWSWYDSPRESCYRKGACGSCGVYVLQGYPVLTDADSKSVRDVINHTSNGPHWDKLAKDMAAKYGFSTYNPVEQTVINSAAALVQSKATGHNCRRCNSRNDYAAANQSDGSYLCYECR